MTKHKVVGIAVLLTAVVATCRAWAGDKPASDEAVLSYSSTPSSVPGSTLIKSPSGQTYRLSLMPERDVKNRIVVLELVLQPATRKKDHSNLLYPPGNWHGYQPFFFSASDFARGAQNSGYGRTRTIPISKLEMQLRVQVDGVKVELTGEKSSEGSLYEFHELTLQVTTQPLTNERP